jgi:hypothetical protein
MGWGGRDGKSITNKVGREQYAVSRTKLRIGSSAAYCILPSAFWLLSDLFLFASNASCLPLQPPKVEKLGPSHLSPADHIDPVNPGRVGGKNPLNADPVRNLPDGKRRSNASLLLANDHSFEGLYSFLLSLHDLDMDPYSITHPEVREICPQLFSLDQLHRIHLHLLPTLDQTRREQSASRPKSQITHSKSQISPKIQFQMTEKILFRIWMLEIYLRLGAWDLLLPYSDAPCPMRRAYHTVRSPNNRSKIMATAERTER